MRSLSSEACKTDDRAICVNLLCPISSNIGCFRFSFKAKVIACVHELPNVDDGYSRARSARVCGLRLCGVVAGPGSCCLFELPSLFLRLSSSHLCRIHSASDLDPMHKAGLIAAGASIVVRDAAVTIRSQYTSLSSKRSFAVLLEADRFSAISIVTDPQHSSNASAVAAKLSVASLSRVSDNDGLQQFNVSVPCKSTDHGASLALHNHALISVQCVVVAAIESRAAVQLSIQRHYVLRCTQCLHSCELSVDQAQELIESNHGEQLGAFDFAVPSVCSFVCLFYL